MRMGAPRIVVHARRFCEKATDDFVTGVLSYIGEAVLLLFRSINCGPKSASF